MDNINKIAVIGTGLMGKGIIHSFAASNYSVNVFGRRDSIIEELEGYFDKELERGRITSSHKEMVLSNIRAFNVNTQAEEIAENDLIIETIKEDLEAKKDMFHIITKHIRRSAILASNTSSYSISKLAEFAPYPEKFIGIHFFSPVPLMKLVEVIKGDKTDDSVIENVCGVIKKIDKLPIKVIDSPGFVLNRGLLMLLNEAAYMLSEKIVDTEEDLDNIFINGMSLKVGPLKLADLIGIDVVYAAISNMYKEFNNEKYKPCPLLASMINEGRIGKKSGKGFYLYQTR